MADGEEELELNVSTKKEKKKSSKPKAPTEAAAIDAAVGGVAAMSVAGARPAASATTAPSGAVKYHDYLFLLERLYQTHNERFGGGGVTGGGPDAVAKCACPHFDKHKLIRNEALAAGSKCPRRRCCARGRRRPFL